MISILEQENESKKMQRVEAKNISVGNLWTTLIEYVASEFVGSAGKQYLGMLAGNVEQAERRAGRFPPPAFPTRSSHRRDVHHGGENR